MTSHNLLAMSNSEVAEGSKLNGRRSFCWRSDTVPTTLLSPYFQAMRVMLAYRLNSFLQASSASIDYVVLRAQHKSHASSEGPSAAMHARQCQQPHRSLGSVCRMRRISAAALPSVLLRRSRSSACCSCRSVQITRDN